MNKTVVSIAAACATAFGVASANECTLDASAPEMPKPKEATEADRDATIAAIKEFQAALAEYRTCLDAVMDNEELDAKIRLAAQKDFNKSVELETDMVEDWQKFNEKYKKANS